MAQQTDAETGIDHQTQTDTDVQAFVDDGEHAVTWHITLIEGDGIEALEIVKSYHEAGLRDEIKTDVIDTSRMPAQYARQELLSDAETELDAAREHFA